MEQPHQNEENDLPALLNAAKLAAQEKLGELSESEAAEFSAWLQERTAHAYWQEEQADTAKFSHLLSQYRSLRPAESEEWEKFRHAHLQATSDAPHRSIGPSVPFLRRWWAVASVILLLAAAATIFLVVSSDRPATPPVTIAQTNTDIAPGTDGAVLTLADGSQVVLDSLGNGVIAMQNGAQVVLQDGQLAYDPTGEAAGSMVYNTMSTPKGRQFNLRLPDGTRVWLNAASSIRYPTIFTGKERKVEVTGEAYFEVVQNKQQPFKVNVADKAEVEVLGTHFNVNAYENESSINTTLLEGSVRVSQFQVVSSDRPASQSGQTASVTLKPGQQAQVLAGRQQTQPGIIIVPNADIDKVMAWKNGAFNFNNVSFEEVMRQLERWYDIEVVYEKGIPDIQFVGKMSKDVSLADLLKGLEESEIRFRIEEGRKLVVMP